MDKVEDHLNFLKERGYIIHPNNVIEMPYMTFQEVKEDEDRILGNLIFNHGFGSCIKGEPYYRYGQG